MWLAESARCQEFPCLEAMTVKRVLVTLATAVTLAAGAAAVVVSLGLFAADDAIVTDKPRPPQIVITR